MTTRTQSAKAKRTEDIPVALASRDITRVARIRKAVADYIAARDIARSLPVRDAERAQKDAGDILKDYFATEGVRVLTLGGLPVAKLSTSTRTVVDTDRLAREFPAAYAACVVEETSDRLTV